MNLLFLVYILIVIAILSIAVIILSKTSTEENKKSVYSRVTNNEVPSSQDENIEVQRLQSLVSALRLQLSQKEQMLISETEIKKEMQKEINENREKINKLTKELELKEQMHQGLKAQYDELEESLINKAQHSAE